MVATLPGGVVTTVTMPLDVITPGCVVGMTVFVPKLKTDSTVGVGEGVGVAVRCDSNRIVNNTLIGQVA